MRAEPPIGAPRTVTAGLAAAIQNRLFWRACEKVSGAINFLRRWYRELPRLSLHRVRCEKGGQDTGGNRDLRQRPHSPRERGSRRVAVVTGYGLRATAGERGLVPRARPAVGP